jgi:hypothetical protein
MKNEKLFSDRAEQFKARRNNLFEAQRGNFENFRRGEVNKFYAEDRDSFSCEQTGVRENFYQSQMDELGQLQYEDMLRANMDGLSQARKAKLVMYHVVERANLEEAQAEDESAFQNEIENIIQNEDEYMASREEELACL